MEENINKITAEDFARYIVPKLDDQPDYEKAIIGMFTNSYYNTQQSEYAEIAISLLKERQLLEENRFNTQWD